MKALPTRPILLVWLLWLYTGLQAQTARLFQGKVLNEAGKPLSFASIKSLSLDITYYATADGSFSIPISRDDKEFTLVITHVGMEPITRTFKEDVLGKLQVFRMQPLSLKLPDVEVNGVRRKTSASNSSIVFDREAIEQTQALSVANVLNYLPGQTILKPTVSIQGATPLLLRTAIPMNSEQALSQAFGISFQIDGNTISNDANMQAMNPARGGFFAGSRITQPELNFIRDRAYKNGTLYNSYASDVANNGIDLRQIPAENIESIEVITGVASARYGDYTNGVVTIERQAGLTPLRFNVRTNEGSQNLGLNKGFKVSPEWGVVNISLDFLNSNDDPRNKLKSFQRVGGSILWTYQQQKARRFKNTLSLDINTTLDKTKVDPDDGPQRMARFTNRNIRISNRSEWIVKKPWLYSVSLQGSYSYGRQESYDQRYLNRTAVMGYTDATETGIHEGNWAPGYYLAVQQIIGEPVSASGRIETRSIFKMPKLTYQLTMGANYSYSANKGPGVIVDPSRPTANGGDKGDRPRPFNEVPVQSNAGVYVENNISTRLLGRVFTTNAGLRGDIQNGFFTVSPRINSNWKLTKKLSWNIAYGVATKAPGLSQLSPGKVYVDIPLVNSYTGKVEESVFLVHTQVMDPDNRDLKPYRSYTFETGFSFDARPLKLSAFYFNRINKDGFATSSQALLVTVPNYTVTYIPGQKVQYAPNGTFRNYQVNYNKISNAAYSRTNGVELMVSSDKIRALQTSITVSTAFYHSYYMNSVQDVDMSVDGQTTFDPNKEARYGVYENQARTATNIKSTIVTTTHIPALRMAVMFSGELFWVNRTEDLASGIYPVGYLDKSGTYFPITLQQAMSPEYAHLLKKPASESVMYLPGQVYPNLSLRLSKEIGDALRFSFNAYNVFNIRPVQITSSGTNYYNGQPSFGAELIFTIK